MGANVLDVDSLQVKDRAKLLKAQSYLKTKECSLCHYAPDLRKEFLFPVASNGTGKLLVVGTQVFVEEHKNTIACSGPFRTIFNNYLSKYTGLLEADCTFTYAVKCTSTDKNNIVKAKVAEYKACSRYLLQEIKQVDPIIILFLGKDSAKSLIDNKTRNSVPVGTPFKSRILGRERWCYFMTNPIVTKTTTAAVPTVEAHFRGLYNFFDKNTNIYDTIPRPLIEHNEVETDRHYTLVDSIEKLIEMEKDLNQYTYIGMDTETTGLEVWKDDFKVVGISLAGTQNKGYYIPIYHSVSNVTQLDWDSIVKPVIKRIVEDPSKQTIWHNLYYDYAALKRMGLNIFKLDATNNIWTHDSMIMTYLHNENSRIGLKDQMYIHFNVVPKKFKGVLESSDVNTFTDVNPANALEYAVDDAINALTLFNKTSKLVKEESNNFTDGKLMNRIYPIELEVVKVLADAHLKGIRLDIDYLNKLRQAVEIDLNETKNAVYSISTAVMNLSSNPRIVEFISSLFEDYFLDRFNKKFGKMSAQEKVLKVMVMGYSKMWNLAKDSIINTDTLKPYKSPGKWDPSKLESYVNLIIRYRHLLKMKSTYIDAIDELKHQVGSDWLIHANIKSIGTTSGRMSSNKPNLQNIPRAVPAVPTKCSACSMIFKDDTGILEDTHTVDITRSRYTCKRCEHVNKTYIYDLRRLYIPRNGMKFIAADYRNMELYLAAAVSGCQELYDVFLKREKDPDDPNGDMHAVTASAILGTTPDKWKKLMDSRIETNKKQAKEARTIAKTVNFLTLYGGSPAGLQETFKGMGIDKTKEECTGYIDAFFNTFPAVKRWFDDQKYNIQNYGHLINAYGRIRHILKEGGEVLSAINMLIQGLGAQIIKESLVDADHKWKDKNWYPLLTIHDENIIEVPVSDISAAEKSIVEIMEVSVDDSLKVDLRVDVSAGVSSLSKAEMN